MIPCDCDECKTWWQWLDGDPGALATVLMFGLVGLAALVWVFW
jgi:hypothetical protein